MSQDPDPNGFGDPHEHETSLYSYGYGHGTLEDLQLYVDQLDATVIDTRYSPSSKNPRWRKPNLFDTFNHRYRHLQACGNVNYKSGGPIELEDRVVCTQRLWSYLRAGESLIRLCYCPSPQECHRTNVVGALTRYVVEELGKEFPDPPCIHLPTRRNPGQQTLPMD